jgi:hypothetical protein
MATSSPLPRVPSNVAAADATAAATYALGALLLAGEAAVHVQQYVAEFHDVRWIGPLFLGNAVAVALTIAGLIQARTRPLAALAGVVISAVALGSLVLSYGNGLFGWQEAGFRTPVALALITEVGAVILMATALMLEPWFSAARRTAGAHQAPGHRSSNR